MQDKDTPAPRPFPWPQASATGVGSLPGTDPVEAIRLILGELPDLPHLPELPARGPGADLTGRTAALLLDLPVDTTTHGWRFTDRPGRDMRQAQSLIARDLDALEAAADGYQGALKIQVCGPWTLAATIELARRQDPALADPGALADLIESLAEGVAAHVADVAKRVPGARVVLQLDEPALPTVIEGGVPTASGLNRLPAVDGQDVEAGLRRVLSAPRAFSLVHCCGMSVPFAIIRRAGAGAVGFDLGQLRRGEEESLAEMVETGLGVLVGAVPATPDARPAADTPIAERRASGQLPTPRATAARVMELWRRMGWPVARQPAAGSGPPAAAGPGASAGPASIAGQVVITPGCGLAGATPGYARDAIACCRESARLLPELIEEEAP